MQTKFALCLKKRGTLWCVWREEVCVEFLSNNRFTVLLRINAGGVHLIFDIFWGAFIQGRRLYEGGVYYKIQKKLQFYISKSMISLSSILKTALSAASQCLESVIRSNGLGRPGSFNTSSCDINCCLPFWQGSRSLKQWIKPSSEPLVLRFKPHDLNELGKGGGGGGGRLFEGGVYSKGAFIK